MKKNFFKATAHAVASLVTLFATLLSFVACNEFPGGEEILLARTPTPPVIVHDTVYQDKYVYVEVPVEVPVEVKIDVYKDYRLETVNGFGFATATITNPEGKVVKTLGVTYLNKVVTLENQTDLGKTTFAGQSGTTFRFTPNQEAYASEEGIKWEKDETESLDEYNSSITGNFSKTVSITTDNGELEIPVVLKPGYIQVVPRTVTVTNTITNNVYNTYYVTRESHLGWGKVTVTDSVGNKVHEWTVRYSKTQVMVPAEQLGTTTLTSANASPWSWNPGEQTATATHSGNGNVGADSWTKDTFNKADDEICLVEGTFRSSVTLTTEAGVLEIPLELNASYLQHTEAVIPQPIKVNAKVVNGEGFSKLTFTQEGGKKLSEFNLKLDSVLIHRATKEDLTKVDLIREANMVSEFTAKQRGVGSSEGDSVVYTSCKFSHRTFGETTSTSSVNGYITTTTYTNKVTLFYNVAGYIQHRDGSKEQFTYELAPWYSQVATVVEDNTPDVETYEVTVDVTRVDECTEKATIQVTGTKGYYAKTTARYSMAFPSPKSDFIVASVVPVAVIDSTWTVTDEFNPVNMWQKASYIKYIKHDVVFLNAAGAKVGPGTTISGWGTEIRTTLPTGEAFRLWCEFDAHVNDSYAAESGVADWTLSDGRVAKYGTTMTQHTTGYTEYRYQIGDKEYVAKATSLLGEGTISMKIYVCTQK